MAEQFYTILTKIGKAKIANASALGASVNFTKFQVGDSNGSYYNPTEDQTELKHKVWEGSIGAVTIDKENPNWIVIETVIPSDVGGFMIREAGIIDDQGNLIAAGKYPETYKPITSEGSSKDLVIRMILEVSNASSVALKVDSTVILATKKDIEILDNKIKNIQVPVKSVNTKTGDIVLKAEDVKTNDGTTLESFKTSTVSSLADKVNNIDVTRTTAAKDVTGAINELNKSMNKNLIIFGEESFNSTTGVAITHNLGTASYRVSITPTTNSNGTLGEYWVESKTSTTFVVKNSGSNTTAKFDWIVIK